MRAHADGISATRSSSTPYGDGSHGDSTEGPHPHGTTIYGWNDGDDTTTPRNDVGNASDRTSIDGAHGPPTRMSYGIPHGCSFNIMLMHAPEDFVELEEEKRNAQIFFDVLMLSFKL